MGAVPTTSAQYMGNVEPGDTYTTTVPACFQEPLAPYIQVRQGLAPDDIVCKEGLVLAAREGGDPLCIREESVQTLLRLGWTVDISGHTDPDDTWSPQSKPYDRRIYCNDNLNGGGGATDRGEHAPRESGAVLPKHGYHHSRRPEYGPGCRRRPGCQQL